MGRKRGWGYVSVAVVTLWGCSIQSRPKGVVTNPAVKAQSSGRTSMDDKVANHGKDLLEDGRRIFRHDTFGSEHFWGGKLGLHKAILGKKGGGVGPGLTPNQ